MGMAAGTMCLNPCFAQQGNRGTAPAPGGAKVVRALETAFALNQGVLDHERDVLADYGNMSGPTVLFVLERARAAGLPSRSLLTSLGPGFTASCVALQHAA